MAKSTGSGRHGHHRGGAGGTRGVLRGAAALVSVVAGLGATAVLTRWPSALIIRAVFTRGGDATAAEMRRHVPDVPLHERLDISYGDRGRETTYDVFRPASAVGPLPTIVWIHGGAWISGGKHDVAPYLRLLANQGFAAIGVNYTRGPEGVYPLAVHQLRDALAHIDRHAEEWGVDRRRIVLAGDSAGAQLASQQAALITHPAYAERLGIRPGLRPDQLAATVLHCGVYDLAALARLRGVIGWGFKSAMWAYSGTRTWAEDETGATMSTIDAVTADFPPTFVSGGNGDGLTRLQSRPLARRLADLGVETTTLFWPDDHEPALPHEYQFHLDLPEARDAFARTLDFLRAHTG